MKGERRFYILYYVIIVYSGGSKGVGSLPPPPPVYFACQFGNTYELAFSGALPLPSSRIPDPLQEIHPWKDRFQWHFVRLIVHARRRTFLNANMTCLPVVCAFGSDAHREKSINVSFIPRFLSRLLIALGLVSWEYPVFRGIQSLYRCTKSNIPPFQYTPRYN